MHKTSVLDMFRHTTEKHYGNIDERQVLTLEFSQVYLIAHGITKFLNGL